MATGADVRDILELTGGENDGPISKKDLINSDKVRMSIITLTRWCQSVWQKKKKLKLISLKWKTFSISEKI